MSRRRLLQSGLWWTLLVVLVSNRMPLRAQAVKATSSQRTAQKDYASTRPTRFNITPIGGTGLVQAISPYTLAAGEAAVGVSERNFDRDPGDIDLVEFEFQGAVGLPKRTEFFLRVNPWFRVNSANLDPLRFPPPPLDLFVDTYPTLAVRTRPPFLFVPNLPYKTYALNSLTETGAFSESSGDAVLGAKVNLRSEDRGDAFGLGVRGFIDVPTETPLYNVPYPGFRNLAGVSGKVNFGGDILFARTWRASELVANIGYKQTGNPERGLRIQMIDSSQTVPTKFLVGEPIKFLVGEPVDIPLRLSNELRISAGWTVPIFHFYRSYWWLISEFNHTHYVGSHTPTERLIHPAEVAVGIQSNVPWYHAVSMGAMWQLVLSDGGKGQDRTTAFQTSDGRGDINFGELISNPQLTAAVETYLQTRGASFSVSSSKVLASNNPAFDSWRNIPVVPGKVQSQGHTGVLVFVTWRIGGRY